ncbi:histidine triad nucleotide-binding protein mitochondrial [Blastocystis sp. subtype 4]|uniref:histidine triad nucleotide-binding protein mitochondrial n=1 Tax=Blastocystis sp. subtype 4 TaxID=944170 RepID=UPI0007119967|nr:histidine triad nucleotide-binding protein mitochondrial [Blastocystis sp. subtype 4]KNB45165.1 histidine triad nucleotide-binding protein mitochondrial [Blastocystis sp. subtype 4]|eukprot:XP_014528608.1 histidine triad nucleotide-binding protein mitochondrial [Blastocystis sp. subtype 4]
MIAKVWKSVPLWKGVRTLSVSTKPTLFEQIADKTIPSDILFEDDVCCAFRDVNPCAPVHFLVVPKKCNNLTQLRNMRDDQEQLVGHLMHVASKLAVREGLEKGYRIVVNDGKEALQSVFHLHIHVIGGKKCGWPPV